MNLLTVLFTTWLSILLPQGENTPAPCKNSQYILSQSQLRHVPERQWNKSELRLHIQEPRINNPQQYSRIVLNNRSDVPSEVQEKYGLNREQGQGYRNFYKTMYGLPMSITEEFYNEIAPAEAIVFGGEEAYSIALELKQEMISEHWRMIISTDDFTLLAVEFCQPESPEEGEIIKFEENMQIEGITLPRMRHWYDKQTDKYLGSDIIVTEID